MQIIHNFLKVMLILVFHLYFIYFCLLVRLLLILTFNTNLSS